MTNGRRLKVALVFDDSLDSQDGVAQHVKTLGAWLSERKHEVSYLVGETKLREWHGGKVYSLSKNLRVNFNGNKMSIPLPAKKSKINEIIADCQFDVIHVMMPYSPFMAQRIINCAPKNTAAVGTFHIYPSGPLASAGSRLLKLALMPSLGRFSEVISVSPAAQSFAKQAFGLKSQVIPNPVNVESYVKSAGSTKQKPGRIVFLGRLVKRKGARQMIEAFSLLNKQDSNAQLLIAGDGPLRSELEYFTKNNGLSECVSFLGFVEENEKPKLLASASVACFPSIFGESFGIVLIEAMAAGAGVVLGGENEGYKSILEENPWALVDANDTAGFAAKLQQALTDENKRYKAHQWQKKAVMEYDIQTVGPKIETVYDLAIARANKNGHNMSHE